MVLRSIFEGLHRSSSKRKDGNLPSSGMYARYTTGMDVFQPWCSDADIHALKRELADQKSTTLVSDERLWTIKWAFNQTRSIIGEIWEAGVYRGGVARFLTNLMLSDYKPSPPTLRLFDSFCGMPAGTPDVDLHHQGDFGDTSLAAVRALIGDHDFVDMRPGWIPQTFVGLEGCAIRLAHVDVDMYEPTLDCLHMIYPKMALGGIIVLDDYGLVSCPGVRKAIDEFFVGTPDLPLIMPSGQAVVVRTGGREARASTDR
jgi:O-methyltransferase